MQNKSSGSNESLQTVMIDMMEQQVSLLNKHISMLKSLPPQPMQFMQLVHPQQNSAYYDPQHQVYVPIAASSSSTGMMAVQQVQPKKSAVASAAAGGEEKKAAKVKKPKDPNHPKKPPSAYLVFMQEEQASMRAANPAMSQKELMTAMGSRWSGLKEADKVGYVRTAEVEKEKYFESMTVYNASKGLPPPQRLPASSSSSSSSSSNSAAKSPKPAKPVTAVGTVMNAVPSPAGSPIASPVKIAKPTEGGEKKKKDKKRKSEGMVAATSEDAEEHVAVVDADAVEPEKKKVYYLSIYDMAYRSHIVLLHLF